MNGPRWLYLHGFASGPRSTKGVKLSEHFATRGVSLQRLDLRVPSLERLSFGAMMRVVGDALGGARDRAVVFGSSLGALAAARVAESDARICALVLLAPAFRIAERWRARLTDEEWRAWETSGSLAIHDYAEDRPTRVCFDFIRELSTLDAAGDGWPDVRVPTLIVHGRADDTVDPQLSRDFAKGKPWVRLVEVDDGHELTQSLPRIVAEAEVFLKPFLGG
ncbi:MAG: YqiA/YcfP family alpha/beta fold hydrolase [Polyangia bacterium]